MEKNIFLSFFILFSAVTLPSTLVAKSNDTIRIVCEASDGWERYRQLYLNQDGERMPPLTIIIEQQVNTDMSGTEISDLLRYSDSSDISVPFKVTYYHDLSMQLAHLSNKERERKIQAMETSTESKDYNHDTRSGVVEGVGTVDMGSLNFTPLNSSDLSFSLGYFIYGDQGSINVKAPRNPEFGNRYTQSMNSYRCFEPEIRTLGSDSSDSTFAPVSY